MSLCAPRDAKAENGWLRVNSQRRTSGGGRHTFVRLPLWSDRPPERRS